ncbi:transporter substrate-binding domain-containing protein [Zooshikella marina]|uniref:substrate-binding periplasmic protein n=1 Tax=Zooshikella ganghwensis TaxID=202772 RepID=UPI001BAEE871|nr:transporter substrate-binding domain-containing protein [Zooshikella ganghwensis]MBU2708263.1 transporter substrate-binding domain-containing protein [Zooshikella ganghwensis]
MYKIIVSLLLFITINSWADPTQGVKYLTEEFPPFNFKGEDGNPAGINTDVLIEMFKKMGSQNSYKDIKIQPWVRGYRTTLEEGSMNVLYSAIKTPERENLFKWVGPLTDSTNDIIVLKQNASKVKIEKDSDLVKYKYAVIREDIGEQLLVKAGVKSSNISYSTNLFAMIKKLQDDKVDAVSYNGTVAKWLIKKQGMNPSDFEIVYTMKLGQHYFAFNKSIDDNVVEAHQKALDAVKNDQALMSKIKDKYLK